MSSSSIQPGCCDDTLSRDDRCRAYFCSEAVYKSSVASATAFLQKIQCDHPIVRFEKVHMSLELLGQQKFLVAYAEDAIFIAFRGTETLDDLATDLKMVNHPKFGGAFHAGFFKRADVFMGSDQNPMKGLLSLNKRIIFCGHSLGGAVAHMVLLRYLLENNWNLDEKSQGQYSNSLISVAFGAPHICDKKGAQNINADKTLTWRFRNFVNQSGPMPCLLHSVANTLAKFKASLESNEIFPPSFALQGGLIPLVKITDAILRGDVREAFLGAFDIGTARFVDKSKTLIATLLNELARRAAPKPGSSNYNEPDFYPIGYYTFIQKQANEWRNTDLQRYPIYTIDDESPHMTRKLKDVRCGFQDWEHHKLENYKTVLMKSGLIDSPQVNSQQPHDCQANNVVSTPAPIITTIRLERADSTQPFKTTITGDNLLFLRDPVKINEMEWKTTVQEDQKIIAMAPSSSSISTETIPSVLVNTAFGKCSKTIEAFLGLPGGATNYCNLGKA
jgi:pimeloyl-ACP methyl ester carboxylesterase